MSSRVWLRRVHDEPTRNDHHRELAEHAADADDLVGLTTSGRVTLVYAARDVARNNAVALREFIEDRRIARR